MLHCLETKMLCSYRARNRACSYAQYGDLILVPLIFRSCHSSRHSSDTSPLFSLELYCIMEKRRRSLRAEKVMSCPSGHQNQLTPAFEELKCCKCTTLRVLDPVLRILATICAVVMKILHCNVLHFSAK